MSCLISLAQIYAKYQRYAIFIIEMTRVTKTGAFLFYDCLLYKLIYYYLIAIHV